MSGPPRKLPPEPSVEDWIDSFIARHGMRFPVAQAAFGAPGRPEYEAIRSGWRKAFDEHGIKGSEANRASEKLQQDPPGFFDSHLKALIDAVKDIRRIMQGPELSSQIISRDRKDVEAESRNCPYCSGGGIATVFHRNYNGNRTAKDVDPLSGLEFTIVASHPAACVCPHGRWLLAHQQKSGGPLGFWDAKQFAEGTKSRDYSLLNPIAPPIDADTHESHVEFWKRFKLNEFASDKSKPRSNLMVGPK